MDFSKLFKIGKRKLKLVTHDGPFHADDVFAAAALSILLEKRGESFEIIRSRDPKIYENGDYVFDVGGVYDEAKNKFDHHQPGGAGKRNFGNIDIEYAAFGLVWRKFSEELSGTKEVGELIDKKLVAPIDAGDNGQALFEIKGELYPYTIQNFLEVAMNPSWQEDVELADKFFKQSVEIAKIILNREIIRAQDRIKSRVGVLKCYENAKDKRLIIFDQHYPVGDTLDSFSEPLFVISQRRSDGLWSLMTLRANGKEDFVNKKDLPKSWGGLKDTELQKVTGVSDAVFCHRGLFLAVAKSKEGAMKMAQIALES